MRRGALQAPEDSWEAVNAPTVPVVADFAEVLNKANASSNATATIILDGEEVELGDGLDEEEDEGYDDDDFIASLVEVGRANASSNGTRIVMLDGEEVELGDEEDDPLEGDEGFEEDEEQDLEQPTSQSLLEIATGDAASPHVNSSVAQRMVLDGEEVALGEDDSAEQEGGAQEVAGEADEDAYEEDEDAFEGAEADEGEGDEEESASGSAPNVEAAAHKGAAHAVVSVVEANGTVQQIARLDKEVPPTQSAKAPRPEQPKFEEEEQEEAIAAAQADHGDHPWGEPSSA